MESLVQQGPLRVIWLAAHWLKKLRQHDFIHADLCDAVYKVLEKQASISLRYTGHLLLGTSKIYSKKAEIFESDAIEFRTKLVLTSFTSFDQSDHKPGVLQYLERSKLLAIGDSQVFHDPEDGWAFERQNLLPSSKSFVASLEDITFKTKPTMHQPRLPFESMGDAFSSLEGEDKMEFEAFMVAVKEEMDCKQQKREMLDTPDVGPLLGTGTQSDMFRKLGNVDVGVEPSSLDMEAPVQETGVELSKSKPDAPSELLGAPAKKRRLQRVILDNQLTLPKAVFKESPEITQDPALDFNVHVLHSVATEPGLTTTLGNVCPALAHTLLWGKKTAEKHRKAAVATEASDVSSAITSYGPGFTAKTELKLGGDGSGDCKGGYGAEAPTSLQDVFKASTKDETKEATEIGYSARTERMRRWLDTKFEAQGGSLSYHSLCNEERIPVQSRREVKASCFLELLVLQTNSMVHLKQDRPYGDIQIRRPLKK